MTTQAEIEERKKLIQKMWEEGYRVSHIIKTTGGNQAAVRQALSEIKRDNPSKASQNARDKEIIELRANGATLHEIGLQYGLTRERVRQITESVGRESVFTLRAKERNQEEYATLKEQAKTMTQREIAEARKISYARVSQLLKKHGLVCERREPTVLSESTKRVLELADGTRTAGEITDIVGLHTQTVRNIVSRYRHKLVDARFGRKNRKYTPK